MQVIIHIGYHKTGTTFLQESIFDKAEDVNSIARPLIYKLLVYPSDLTFDAEDVRQQFRRLFRRDKINVISHERLSGMPHLGSRDSYSIMQRLKECFPEAKILVAIREQESMIISLYNQFVIDFGSLSIDQYLQPKFIRKDASFNLNILKYNKLISAYQESFGVKNVLVLPIEALRKDHDGYLDKVLKFTTIKRATFNKSAVNISPKLIYISLKRRFNPWLTKESPHLADTYYNGVVGPIILGILKIVNYLTPDALNNVLLAKRKRYIRKIIEGYYCNDNAKLDSMTDFDLRDLGYAVNPNNKNG